MNSSDAMMNFGANHPGVPPEVCEMAAAAALPTTLNRQCGYPACTAMALRGRGGLCGSHWEEVQRATSGGLASNDPSISAPPKPGTMKAPRKRCITEGCEKVAKGRCEGRCQAHFKEYLRSLESQDGATAGTDASSSHHAAAHIKRTKFFCSVEDCNRQAAGGTAGFCTKHFREFNPEEAAAKRTGNVRKCRFVDDNSNPCDKLAQGGCAGLCKRHWNISAPPGAGPGKKQNRCKSSDCEKFSRRKGYCQKHFREMYPDECRNANAPDEHTTTAGGKRCSAEGCKKYARGKVGMCRRHAREAGLVDDGPANKPAAANIEADVGGVGVGGALHGEAGEEELQMAAAEAAAAADVAVAALDAVGAEEDGGSGAVHGEDDAQTQVAQTDAVRAAEAAAVVDEITGGSSGKCYVEHCENPPGIGGYRGLCIAHWLEEERAKSIAEQTTYQRRQCSVNGCTRQARSEYESGMCQRHAREAGVVADRLHVLMSPSKRRKMDTLAGVAAIDAVVDAHEAVDSAAAIAAAEAVAAAALNTAEATGAEMPEADPEAITPV